MGRQSSVPARGQQKDRDHHSLSSFYISLYCSPARQPRMKEYPEHPKGLVEKHPSVCSFFIKMDEQRKKNKKLLNNVTK